MNIICLDIDDCIRPAEINALGITDDEIQLVEINLKRLKLLLEKTNSKVFITSSWYSLFVLDEGILKPKANYYKDMLEIYGYDTEIQIMYLMCKYLKNDVIGLSCGDRKKDIENLLQQENKVVALDDMDLSDIEHKNYLYCYTDGLITNRIGYRIVEFYMYDIIK